MAKNPNALKAKGSTSSSKRKQVQIAENIKISQENHDKLAEHIKDRLLFGDELRNTQVDRYEIIDKEVAGYILLDEEDKKRAQDNVLGKGPKITDGVLPLTISQLDEAVTFLLSVLAPDSAIYSAIAIAEKQEIAKGFANLMNKNADTFGHYRHMARGLFEMMKYKYSQKR